METQILSLMLLPFSFIAGGILVLMTQRYMRKDEAKRKQEDFMMEIRKQSRVHTLPLRMAAYERCMLLLERISPQALIPRIEIGGMECRDFQLRLVQEVRAEFEHNLAQQLYISEEAWAQMTRTKENIILLIHKSASAVDPKAGAKELAKRLIEQTNQQDRHPAEMAIQTLKKEVKALF
jgi:hypothetical protein